MVAPRLLGLPYGRTFIIYVDTAAFADLPDHDIHRLRRHRGVYSSGFSESKGCSSCDPAPARAASVRGG
jgi:hypothetical protein